MPDAYTLERAGAVRAAIRRDLVPRIGPWLLAPALELPLVAERLGSGRGGAWRVELPGGLRVVVRFYRRGGLVARVVATRTSARGRVPSRAGRDRGGAAPGRYRRPRCSGRGSRAASSIAARS
jgi:hypothetical protein